MALRLIIAVVGILLGTTVTNLLASDLPSLPIISIAERVEAGAALDRESAAVVEPPLNHRYSCRRDIQRAFLTLRLALLDAAMGQSAPFERANAAYEKAADQLKYQLGCFPLDGNAWLRFAMVELAFSGPTKSTVEYVRLSQRTSPYEEWVLRIRVPLLVALARTQSDVVQILLRDDLSTLMRYGRVPFIREIWKRLGSHGRRLMADELSTLSIERRRALQRVFDKTS